MDKLEDGWDGCHLPLVLFTSFLEFGNTRHVVTEYRRGAGHSLQTGGGADKEWIGPGEIHFEGTITAHILKFPSFIVTWRSAALWSGGPVIFYVITK